MSRLVDVGLKFRILRSTRVSKVVAKSRVVPFLFCVDSQFVRVAERERIIRRLGTIHRGRDHAVVVDDSFPTSQPRVREQAELSARRMRRIIDDAPSRAFPIIRARVLDRAARARGILFDYVWGHTRRVVAQRIEEDDVGRPRRGSGRRRGRLFRGFADVAPHGARRGCVR